MRSGDLAALAKRLDALVAAGGIAPRGAQGRAGEGDRGGQGRQGGAGRGGRALAESEQWRTAGERLRALVDIWKALPRLDRKADDELWHRFSHARSAFSKRRKAHFASLDSQREEARRTKEKLVTEAQALSNSTDWGPPRPATAS